MKKILVVILLGISIIVSAQIHQEIHLGIHRTEKARFHPNSDLIAFTVDKRVKLYRSGIHMATLNSRDSRAKDIDFDLEGNSLLVGHKNGELAIWDVKDHLLKFRFNTQSGLIGSRFLHSSEKIVVATHFQLSFWNLQGELLSEIPNYGQSYFALCSSKDGNYVVVGGSSEYAQLYNSDGEFLKEILIRDFEVNALAINPDKTRLVIGNSRGHVDLYNLETGHHISNLINVNGPVNSLEFSNDGNYIAVGAESLYIISLTNDRHNMVFRRGYGDVLSLSFSPDGKEIAVVEDLSPYGKIFDITDLNIPSVLRFRDNKDNIAPQIYISNPPKIVNERINYSRDLIPITGSVFDDYGVRALRINGIQTPVKENGKFIINLPLTMGENAVSLEALDINGNISAKRFVVIRKADADRYDASVAKNYLFAVGIDDYYYWPELNNAVKDVNDLASVLLEQYNFGFSDITIIKNEQATQRNILEGLRSMIEKVTPHDNIIIYFSGHGYFDELLNEGYWIPADAEDGNQADYLANSSILKVLENINSQHSLLIADACFSGSLFSNSRGGGENPYISQVEKYRSRWGIASGRLEAVSDGMLGQNSPFAATLIGYLIENKREEFAVSELVQYVKMNVPGQSGQTPIGGPLRLEDDEGGEFVFRRGKSGTAQLNKTN